MKTDTIAAIATAMSNSGIGIIRVSGAEAIRIVDDIFRFKSTGKKLSDRKSHTIHYGFIVDKGYDIVDEVLVSVMKAPNSYTAEDVVEINCHGGVMIMNTILKAVIDHGARLAEPGEFTKRAFLNGRMDLSEAEAVMDIIQSKNKFALKSSVNQLTGILSDAIRSLRDDIIYEVAFIESALDDPEHISLDEYGDHFSKKINNLMESLNQLLLSADNGRILKEGINTVIIGKPNAGKSSLLNILAGTEKAIVTEVAGTTRDILEETIMINGITFNILDTAGIRRTDDIVEKIGVSKAKKCAEDADLIVYVVDTSLSLDESDEDIVEMIGRKKTIILLNKSDLNPIVKMEELLDKFDEENRPVVIKTSTKDHVGIDTFEKTVTNMFINGKVEYNNEVFITNMRHREAINNALESLALVKESFECGMPEDFYTIDFMNAYNYLGTIIGEEVEDDLVNEIFSKFCMGK